MYREMEMRFWLKQAEAEARALPEECGDKWSEGA
jgi:hypothetical protein